MIKFLASLQLTIVLFILLIFGSIAGTLVNQQDALKFVYHSWWFISILGALGLNILVCTFYKRKLTFRNLGFLLTHLAVIIILIGGIVGAVFGQKGFLSLEVNEMSDHFYIDKKPVKLDFHIALEEFKLERYEEDMASKSLGRIFIRTSDEKKQVSENVEINKKIDFYQMASIEIVRYEPHFFIDLKTKEFGSRDENPVNPAIYVKIHEGDKVEKRWVFAKFPGMTMSEHRSGLDIAYFTDQRPSRIKDFKSTLVILEDEKEVLRKTIEVNDPLEYKGYRFYQNSYDQESQLWSGLEVVKDPGLWIIYFGFLLLCLGVVFIFYVKPLISGKW
ncbi:MAG: cytochrome c biogenesis protein ResB [Pseudomonadota bacterium]